MKCPECDLEQPDSTVLCAKCGLSFEAWRAMNPEPEHKPRALEQEMTFPVSPEEEPEPEEEPAAPPAPVPAAPGPSETPAGEKSSQEKKSFQWTKLHSAGLGLLVAIGIAVFFLTRPHSQPQPSPAPAAAPTVLPTVWATPDGSTTPGAGALAVTPSPAPTEAAAKMIPAKTPTDQPKAAPAHS